MILNLLARLGEPFFGHFGHLERRVSEELCCPLSSIIYNMDPDFERMVAQAQVRPQNRGDVGVPDKQVFLLAAEYLLT
jgi:hypothetical protein